MWDDVIDNRCVIAGDTSNNTCIQVLMGRKDAVVSHDRVNRVK